MKFALALTALLCSLACGVTALPAADGYGGQDPEAAAAQALVRVQAQYNRLIEGQVKTSKTCTPDRLVKRREWGTLSKRERREYIDAVKCMQRLPPKISKKDAPGSRSRFDDFSATHIIQTPFVHFSGLFLHFHRYLVLLWEQALREECGYGGYQPYWDWTISWQDPSQSTVFDGSPYSMGSNGKYIPHGPTQIAAFGLSASIPPGTGGGCVYSGPFTNYTVDLGPVAFDPKGPDGGLGYNPRCLVRDLSPIFSNNTRPSRVLDVITGNYPDIAAFDARFEALDGVHAGGHFTMGGLGLDAYSSAGDPAFWLHHSQVDRTWALWQAQNPANRTNQVWGTGTAFNNPPSANITPDTLIDVGVLGPKRKLGEFDSTIANGLCYEYV